MDEEQFDFGDLDEEVGPTTLLGADPIERRLHFYARDLEWLERPLPGACASLGAAEACALDDDEVFNRIDLVAVSVECAHSPARSLKASPYRDILIAAARRLGAKQIRTSTPTFEDFQRFVRTERLREINGESKAAAERAAEARVQAVARFCEAAGLVPETRLDWLFSKSERFAGIARALLANPANQDLEPEIEGIATSAKRMLDSAGLSAAFSGALNELMRLQSISLDQLAETSRVSCQRIRKYLGGAQPHKNEREMVSKLEDALGVERGVLFAMVTSSTVRVSTDRILTKEFRDRLDRAGIPIKALPDDWPRLSDEQKLEWLSWIEKHWLNGSPYRRYLQQKNAAAIVHEELPPIMADEFAELREFKMADNPAPTFDRVRHVTTNGFWVKKGGKWGEESANLMESHLRRHITALKQVCLNKGFGTEWVGSCGLAFIASAECTRQAADEIARRRCKNLKAANAFRDLGFNEPASGLVYSYPDVDRLITMAGLIDEDTGFLYHNPPVLAPIPGLIDEAWIAKAQQDWKGTIAAERQKITRVIKAVEAAAKKIRNPWFAIEGLLSLDDPLTPVYQAVDRMADDRPSSFGAPLAAARHDRDHLLVSLLLHTKLRRETLSLLTYRADNKGHLRWTSQRTWELHIPQSEIKNRGSDALPKDGSDLILELEPTDWRLYQSIKRWIEGPGSSRRLLHGDGCGDWLFPGASGKDAPLSLSMIYHIVVGFSTQYVAYCPWREGGIKDVLPFGPHAIRDLTATHVLKQTGSIEAAARAIFDTPETVKKRYARFLTVEQSRATNRTIRETVKRDPACGSGRANQ